MTSQSEPPGEVRPALAHLRPLRDLAVYALVGLPVVLLFVALLRLIPSDVGEQFTSRTQGSFYDFVNLPVLLFPIGAVLLALIGPRHPKARLITLVALVEYAIAGFLGVVFGILVGLVKIAGFSVRSAFEELLVRVAWLAVLTIATYAVWELWRNLFAAPKPQPGVYGQPVYGVPGTYPGQPGYGPAPAPPALAQFSPAQTSPAAPSPAQFSPAPPAPAQFSPAQSSPAAPSSAQFSPAPPVSAQAGGTSVSPTMRWGVAEGGAAQPWGATAGESVPGAPVATQPASAYPGTIYPAAAPSVPAQPAVGFTPELGRPTTYGSPPPTMYGSPQPQTFADPTQVDATDTPDDHTHVVSDERPGFGPAGEDPPRR
ncbi:hypothetical protein [Krasilnikovia sp. MM14-A1259]|uniref:hypothetical protein n=1 Tax=Krasilnikovia sp. MM14-A1259 TaxID=3373539 RepID=UPI003811063B